MKRGKDRIANEVLLALLSRLQEADQEAAKESNVQGPLCTVDGGRKSTDE